MSLKKFVSDKGSVVLSFYNVVNQDDKGVRDSIGITVDPEDLKANIQELLDDGIQFVPLYSAIKNRRPNTVSLMARDGYDLTDDGNIVEFAEIRNIPLSFSIPAKLVGVNRPSWTNQIEIALQQALEHKNDDTESVTVEIPRSDGKTVSFATAQDAINARNTLKDHAVTNQIDGETLTKEFCANLTTVLDGITITPTIESDSPFDRKMTWDQIKKLSRRHIIVSHGFSHSKPYTSMDDDEIIEDINLANINFSAYARTVVEILTYPEGKADDRVQEAVANTRIVAAFTMDSGAITADSNKMRLPLNDITQADLVPE